MGPKEYFLQLPGMPFQNGQEVNDVNGELEEYAGLVHLKECDPFQLSGSPDFIFQEAVGTEQFAYSSGKLTRSTRLKALWLSHAYIQIACMRAAGDIISPPEGTASYVKNLRLLRRFIGTATPMPPLFPEMRDADEQLVIDLPLKGENNWIPPDEFPLGDLLGCERAPFVVLTNGDLIISDMPDRHLTMSGGIPVFAAGYTEPDERGGLKVVVKSFDYAIPRQRSAYVQIMFSLLTNPQG